MKRAGTIRRMLAALLAAVMLLGMLPAAAINTEQEYIVPLEQAEYGPDEMWKASSLPDSAGNNENGSIYATEAGAWVRYPIPEEVPGGTYRVEWWYPANKEDSTRLDAVIQTGLDSGIEPARIHLTASMAGGWMEIGTFRFESDGERSITLRTTDREGEVNCRAADIRLTAVEESSEPTEVCLVPGYANNFEGEDPLQGWSGSDTYRVEDGQLVGENLNDTGALLTAQTGVDDYTVQTTLRIESGENKAKSAGLIFRYQDEGNFYHFRLDRNTTTTRIQLLKFVDGSVDSAKTQTKTDVWETDRTYTMKVEVQGSRIRCWLDGEEIFDYVDSEAFLTGGIGVRTYACTALFDDLTLSEPEEEPTPPDPGEEDPIAPELPYVNPFQSNGLDGWTVSNSDVFTLHPTEETLQCAGQGLATVDGLFAESCSVSATVRFAEKSGANAGVVLRYSKGSDGAESYYHFRITSDSSGQAHLYKWTNGSSQQLMLKGFSWSAGREYELRVEADGSCLRCYIDGQEIFSYLDENPLPGGSVGIRSYGNTQAKFDDLTVVELDPPQTTLVTPEEGTQCTELPISVEGQAKNAARAELTILHLNDNSGEEAVVSQTQLNLDSSGEFAEKIYLPNGNYRAEVTAYRNDEKLFSTAAASFTVEAQSGPFTAELEREKDLPVEGPVRICFSMPVDPQTLDGIRLLDKDGAEIAAAVQFPAEDKTGCTLELTPEEPLEYGTAYQVSLPVTVKDILGNGLETAELTFWTVADRTDQLLDSPDGEVEISLNGTWYFAIDPDQRGERERWYELSAEAGWDMLPVPGNWDTEAAYADYKGTAWYRRSFQVPEEYAGYAVYLELTSVYYDCTVWINGQKAGYHTGGYTTFQFPVEQYLNFGGENVIAIMTSNASYEQPGDWGDGAWWKWGGISGGALLRVNNGLKLDWQHITSVPSLDEENQPESAALTMDYRIRSSGNTTGTYYLVSQVFRRESGEPVGEAAVTQVTFSGGEETCEYSAAITLEGEEVHLWHFDDPYLYLVRTELRNEAGQVVHAVEDNIGIREIRLDESTFYLNGEPLRMTGANRVGDDRVNGHTEPDYVIMRDIDYMKSMGMNCARVSHIPMSKNMLDYCDEVGFLLICEGGMWGDPPEKVGDSYVPVPWYTEMIERDYNHPSIFAWSIGNEMHGNRAETREYSAFMVEYIKENMDSSRPVMEVSNTGANNSNDSLQYSEGFVGYNAYGNGSNTAKSLRNRYPDKPIFFTEIGYSQMVENPDDASLNAQGLIDMYRDQPYIFGISLWTLNDYRSHLFGTPVSQNRPWGVITVWGEKKRSYDVLREAFSPVEDLSIRLSGNTEQPGDKVVLQVEMQINSADDIPAYPLRNAALKWEAAGAEGKIIASGLDELPELQPGAQPYILTGVITVPEGGVRSVRATVIDALGYEVAETWRHCQSPDGLPEITGVAAASGELRVYFNGVDYADSYVVRLESGGTTQSKTVYLNRFADFTGLTPDTEYSVTIAAKNSAGEGPRSEPFQARTAATDGVLPPIIWHTEPVENGFFIGYAVKNGTDTYDVRYGTQSGEYTQTITGLTTLGAVKIDGLAGGQTYYYQMRRVSEDGTASVWSQEMTVTPEVPGQLYAPPKITGAAANGNAVSLTIDPTWKATGYTVRYGTEADQLDHSVFIHRAEVEQLMITGLEEGQTYYFTVAAWNKNGEGEASQPVSVTAKESESTDTIVAELDGEQLAFPVLGESRRLVMSIFNTWDEAKNLTLRVEDLPEGVAAQETQTFRVDAASQVEIPILFTANEDAVRANGTAVISLWDGETEVFRSTVALILDCTILVSHDYENENELEDYQNSGGNLGVKDGKLVLKPSGGQQLSILKEGSWEQYIVESEMTMTGTVNGAGAGIVFHYQDEKNFYHVRLNDNNNGEFAFQAYCWKDGTATQLASALVERREDGIYRIQAIVPGDGTAQLFLNGELLLTIDLEWSCGGVGFRSYGRETQFNNLYLYLYDWEADKSELRAIVERCKAYSAQDYTEESFAELQTSLNEALAVLENKFASQSQVDEALEALEAAEEALEPTSNGTSVPTYRPETETGEHGTVSISPLFPRQGQTVTITPKPEEGYELKSLTVTDKNGKPVEVTEQADGTWKFTQPVGKVTITAEFAPVESITFSDVEAGSWYEAAVNAMVEAGLMQGTGNNMFQPFGTVTRATMWTILARMDGAETAGGGSWYEKAQAWAVAEGVSDGTNPDAVVTREQIAAMLYRYAGSPAAEGTLDFADSGDISDWAADAMAWAVAEGILTGTPDGRLNPQGTATRAEAAVMLRRFDGMK